MEIFEYDENENIIIKGVFGRIRRGRMDINTEILLKLVNILRETHRILETIYENENSNKLTMIKIY